MHHQQPQHYTNSFLSTSSLHDLNAVDSRPSAIGDPDPHHDSPDHDSNAVDCMDDSFRTPLPLHDVGVDADRSSIDDSSSSRTLYHLFSIDDVSPIESARARFLQIILDYFISDHVIQLGDSEPDYTATAAARTREDKLSKRKCEEVQYEGDPRFALPLMYVANMYETLVNDVNMRLASSSGIRDKTIAVALEAAGGLYRRLAKKFPKKGSCIFKRRELATSLETRTRFPELVIQEEKRVRFVVVNGLDIVEKPENMPIEDAEWFKRLTGRNEVAISARDYKFYSPRHKCRRVNVPGLPSESQQQTPSKLHMQPFSHQTQFHSMNQNHHQQVHQNQHATHFTQNHAVHLSDIAHTNQSPNNSQHMTYLQPLTGHVGGRLHLMPSSPAKFCDECGSQYLRETSKFCSECGTKRLGI